MTYFDCYPTTSVSARNIEFLEKRLNPVKHGIRSNCFEGTRKDILRKIYAWAKDSSKQNILWLSGSPGAGKSAIATTAVSYLLKKQPTVTFYFERGHAALGDPAALWYNIAFGLACHDPALQNDIVQVLKDPQVDVDYNIRDHFKHLIEGPLIKNHKIVSAKHPLVIVVDALDECNSSDSTSAPRDILLQTVRRWSQLPKQFKLIVTSRPESDIVSCLEGVSQHIVLQTGDQVTSQTSQDIQHFFKHHLSIIAKPYHPKLSAWPKAEIIDQLTKQAAGLFIWAETVIRFMKQGVPTEQLSLILDGKLGMGDIDSLYLTILRNSFNTSTLESFNVVVGSIVLARLPLTCNDLEKLLHGVETDISIAFVLDRLKSVISIDHENGIQIMHQTFADFLKDVKRSGEAFAIDQPKQSKTLALGCLRVMNGQEGLRFNICNLETSHVFNNQMVDLTALIKTAIPSHLSYACCFWAQHLQDIPKQNSDSILPESVDKFAHTHLLHWLEVLSLIDKVSVASKALDAAGQWFQVGNKHKLMEPEFESLIQFLLSDFPCGPFSISGRFQEIC